MKTLFIKEIQSFLSSLIGYIAIGVFLVVSSLFLWVFPMDFNLLNSNYASLDGLFMLAPWVFLFLIPAITMRSFAEETKSGTIELLLTKPISVYKVVLAKYFAAVVIVLLSIIPTLFYYFTMYKYANPVGNIDSGGIWGSYIGLVFLGATFTSIGIFSSSITKNQIVSFIVSVFLCFIIYVGFEFVYNLKVFGQFGLFIQSLGMQYHYESISKGYIDTRDVIYFICVNALFILLSNFVVEKRKF